MSVLGSTVWRWSCCEWGVMSWGTGVLYSVMSRVLKHFAGSTGVFCVGYGFEGLESLLFLLPGPSYAGEGGARHVSPSGHRSATSSGGGLEDWRVWSLSSSATLLVSVASFSSRAI